MSPDDLIFLGVAFILGFLATRMRLPALIGYLVAGFALHGAGYASTPLIESASSIGVMLLLFGIGLKLKLGILASPKIWGTSVVHLSVFTGITALVLAILAGLGAASVVGLGGRAYLLIAFALGFSSTVFAVQALQKLNEEDSVSGRAAVGVLVVQDLIAVAFLVVSSGDTPSLWAVPAVLIVIVCRPVFGWLMSRVGHGELLVLFGVALSLGVGAGVFDQVGLKPELGALVVGVLLSSHDRASELSHRLLDLKDLLLVGFFLSIGLGGFPSIGSLGLVLVFVALLPLKAGLFFLLFTRFRLRPRAAFHASTNLTTYSEFGLIVAAAAAADGHLGSDWVATIAVAVATSFVLASPLAGARFRLYARLAGALGRFDRQPSTASGFSITDTAHVLVFGMGRTGTGAYDEIVRRLGAVALGIERDRDVVATHGMHGRNVVVGDALDRDFWDRFPSLDHVDLIVVATDNHRSNLECVARSQEFAPQARIAAIATHRDEVAELVEAGVDVARDLYEEAGQGLADDALGWDGTRAEDISEG